MNFFPRSLVSKISLTTLLLILAIIVGTTIRTWKITALPFPPNGDELFFGYYGWSLLHFQTDEFGNFLPLSFVSIGDFKYPVLAYLNIVPAAFFGLSEITTRFWSVISGITLIPLIYLLSKQLFKNSLAAVVSAWAVALSPWSISMSRLGLENHIAFVILLTALILILALRDNNGTKKRRLFISISILILLLMAMFSYGAQKIFVPIFLLFLLLLSLKSNLGLIKIRKLLLILLITLTSISALSFLSWQTRGRADSVIFNPLKDSSLQNQITQLNIESGISPISMPLVVTRAFNNKLLLSINQLIKNYINHFSPDFLFFEGESSVEKIPYSGQLLLIDLMLLPIGLLSLRKQSKTSFLITLGWLLLSPIPSAATVGAPHINRASMIIPALGLLSGLGFSQILSWFKGRTTVIAAVLLASLGLLTAFYSLNLIFVHKPVFQPWYSETVNKQLVSDVSSLKNQYQNIAISKDEFIFFLFYNKISPQEFIHQSDIQPLTRTNPWDRVNRMGKINFKMPYECPKSGRLNVLYVCRGENIPQNSTVLQVIRYLDELPAYTFIEFYPVSKIPNPLPKLPDRLKYMVDVEKNPKYPDGIIPETFPTLW